MEVRVYAAWHSGIWMPERLLGQHGLVIYGCLNGSERLLVQHGLNGSERLLG